MWCGCVYGEEGGEVVVVGVLRAVVVEVAQPQLERQRRDRAPVVHLARVRVPIQKPELTREHGTHGTHGTRHTARKAHDTRHTAHEATMWGGGTREGGACWCRR